MPHESQAQLTGQPDRLTIRPGVREGDWLALASPALAAEPG